MGMASLGRGTDASDGAARVKYARHPRRNDVTRLHVAEREPAWHRVSRRKEFCSRRASFFDIANPAEPAAMTDPRSRDDLTRRFDELTARSDALHRGDPVGRQPCEGAVKVALVEWISSERHGL